MGDYKKFTLGDCLSVANDTEFQRMQNIFDIDLLKKLAKRYCDCFGYKLGNYIGNYSFDATLKEGRAYPCTNTTVKTVAKSGTTINTTTPYAPTVLAIT